jgi:DNA-binding NarL/FixJ family response regulator
VTVQLSPTERLIVDLIAEGVAPLDIAEDIGVSRSTLRDRVARIAAKLAGEERVTWADLPRLLEEAEADSLREA